MADKGLTDLIRAMLGLGATVTTTGASLAVQGVGLVGSIASLQTSLVNMTTGFEVGFAPMIKAFNDSVEAVHQQEQQTTAMGVQRESLRAALMGLDGDILKLPGNIDEVMNTAIGLFQFGIGANMETSLELANTLRLQGKAGLALVKGFNSMGRSLFMTQDAIDGLQQGILDSTENQSITTEALLKGLSETAQALQPGAMIAGLSESLMKVGTVAGNELGEAGMDTYGKVMGALLEFSNIGQASLLGIDMGWVNKIAELAESDPTAAFNAMKEKMAEAGMKISEVGKGESAVIQAKLIEDQFGELGRLIFGFNNAVRNAAEGVGAGLFGKPVEGKEIGESTLAQAEQFMNSIREQANTLGDLQERNAVNLHDMFKEKIIDPVADAFGELIVDPLAKDTNLIDFATSYSTALGTMLTQMRSFISFIPGINSSMGSLLSGFTLFNTFITDTLIPTLADALAGVVRFSGDMLDIPGFGADVRSGFEAVGIVPGRGSTEPITPDTSLGDAILTVVGAIDGIIGRADLFDDIKDIAASLEEWRADKAAGTLPAGAPTNERAAIDSFVPARTP